MQHFFPHHVDLDRPTSRRLSREKDLGRRVAPLSARFSCAESSVGAPAASRASARREAAGMQHFAKPENALKRADELCRNASSSWTVVRPAGLANSAGKGKYIATEAGGASFSPISRDDVALFLADEVEACKYDRSAVQLYAA